MAEQARRDVPGGAAEPTVSEFPDTAVEVTAAFYNVGIQLAEYNSKNWSVKEGKLRKSIADAFHNHSLDMLCLSELGELGIGFGGSVPQGDVGMWISRILQDSAVPPVQTFCDSHYVTLVRTGVKVVQYNLIARVVVGQPDRSFQHFRVLVAGDPVQFSIINCHAPASQKRPLTAPGRVAYFNAFHRACRNDRFIWAGDFNTKLIQLTALMQGLDPRFSFDGHSRAWTYAVRLFQSSQVQQRRHSGDVRLPRCPSQY